MKLQRLQHKQTAKYELAIEIQGSWKIIEDSTGDLLYYLLKPIDEIVKDYKLTAFNESDYSIVLPFRPLAYRDFMLYEKHAIEAARGFVRKYLPKLLPIVKFYEAITGKTFPKLKPSTRYYKYPIFYMGNHLNFIADGDSIAIPSYTKELDYELEIAAILGKPLKNAKPEDVSSAIAGFVILNDFSARDVQLDEMGSGFGPMKTKNFGSSISTIVISADELLSTIDNLSVEVLINDKVITKANSSNKLFSFQEAIAYASWEEQLHPGELFASGTIPTCTGIENGKMLQSGDTVTFIVDKMGTLSNKVK